MTVAWKEFSYPTRMAHFAVTATSKFHTSFDTGSPISGWVFFSLTGTRELGRRSVFFLLLKSSPKAST